MQFTNRDVLKSAILHFLDNFYKDAVINLRRALRENDEYRDHWEGVVRLIVNRELDVGEPFYFVADTANLPLDENTDEEAYKWLVLMLINSMGSEDTIIIEY